MGGRKYLKKNVIPRIVCNQSSDASNCNEESSGDDTIQHAFMENVKIEIKDEPPDVLDIPIDAHMQTTHCWHSVQENSVEENALQTDDTLLEREDESAQVRLMNNPGENISLKISEKFCSKIFGDLHRFSNIVFRISWLFAKYLCNFIHTFRKNTISSLKNADFFILCKFRNFRKNQS